MTAAVQPDARRFHVTRVDDDTGLAVQDCRMTILASVGDTGGHLGVVHIVAPPGHEPPLHVHHDEDEAYFVLAGRLSGPGLPVPRPPDVELLGRLFARHHIEV